MNHKTVDRRKRETCLLALMGPRRLSQHVDHFWGSRPRPVVSVEAVQQAVGVSFANANDLTRALEQLGLLRETTGQKRNRRFAYQPFLTLFADEEQSTPEVG